MSFPSKPLLDLFLLNEVTLIDCFCDVATRILRSRDMNALRGSSKSGWRIGDLSQRFPGLREFEQ